MWAMVDPRKNVLDRGAYSGTGSGNFQGQLKHAGGQCTQFYSQGAACAMRPLATINVAIC